MFGTRKKAAADEEEQFALVVKLRDLPFFQGFSPSQLARVADLAEAVEAVPGAVLIDQVGQGRCRVRVHGSSRRS